MKSCGRNDIKPISVGDGFLSGCRGLLSVDLVPLSHPHITTIGNYFLSGCERLRGVDASVLSQNQLTKNPHLLASLNEDQFVGASQSSSRGVFGEGGCVLS